MHRHSSEYEIYIRSPEWKQKAAERLRIDNYRCVVCGAKGTRLNPLQVHHCSYKNLGHEDIGTDIVTLCQCCHKGHHRLLNRITDPETGRRGWTDELTEKDAPGVLQLADDVALYY